MSSSTAGDLSVEYTATQADAALVVQLMNGPMGQRAMDGLQVLYAYDPPPSYEQLVADHPKDSQAYRDVMAVLMFNETVGTFVKQGLLDRGLVYDLFWVKGGWDSCAAIALHQRASSGVAQMYENFEALAAGQTG